MADMVIRCPWCGRDMVFSCHEDDLYLSAWSGRYECYNCGCHSPNAVSISEEECKKVAQYWADVCEKVEPCSSDKYSELWMPVLKMSAQERLEHIRDIALDWDGYRSAKGLGGLIDEIRACCVAPYEE